MATRETWRLGHRPELDGLRGLAILLVLFGHGGFAQGHAIAHAGVYVFFTLSGFLITRVIVEANESDAWSLRRFYGNRMARLFPALLVMVSAVTAFYLWAGELPGRALSRAATALLYVENFAVLRDEGSPLLNTWSLAVEEQFYLLWPLVLVALVLPSRRRLRLALMLVLGSLALRMAAFAVGWDMLAERSLLTTGFALLIGCGLALLPSRPRAAWWMLPVGGPALMATLTFSPLIPAPVFPLIVSGCTALVLASAATVRSRVLGFAPFRFCGRISYAAYLWHYPLLTVAGVFNAGVRSLPVLAFTAMVATGSTFLIEEPIRRWWRRRGMNQAASNTAHCGSDESRVLLPDAPNRNNVTIASR